MTSVAQSILVPSPSPASPSIPAGASRDESDRRDRPPDWFTRKDLTPAFFQPLLADSLGRPDLEVTGVAPLDVAHGTGAVSYVTGAGRGQRLIGVVPLVLTLNGDAGPERLEVMVKSKAHSDHLIRVLDGLAFAASEALGNVCMQVDHNAWLQGSHTRELAVYRSAPTGLRDVMPRVYGTYEDARRDAYVAVLEFLGDQVVLRDTIDDIVRWRREDVDAALAGIAGAHAVWLGREQELLAQPWMEWANDARHTADQRAYFHALADHLAGAFPELLGDRWLLLARRELDALPECWSELERMPRTLIHGDFTPRNLALRKDGLRLVAYDWEVATLHVPQRDLAELLAHVLPPDVEPGLVDHHVEVHRRALERAAGVELCAKSWRRGYRIALADLAFTRLQTILLSHSAIGMAYIERTYPTAMRLLQIENERDGDDI